MKTRIDIYFLSKSVAKVQRFFELTKKFFISFDNYFVLRL